MQKRTYISIISTVLFALYFVLAPSLLQAHEPVKVAFVAEQADDENQEDTSFSELSLDVIIPSYAFDFGGDVVFFPAPQFEILIENRTIVSVVSSGFSYTYFDKLFEHIIATNAP